MQNKLRNIADIFRSRELLTKLGLGAERLIKNRTRKGVDVYGKAFKPYSAKYAEKRSKTGLPVHPVNLSFDDISGMLTEIEHVVSNDLEAVELEIKDDEKRQIAFYHNVSGAGKGKILRVFWGISDDEEKALQELADDEVSAILKNLE